MDDPRRCENIITILFSLIWSIYWLTSSRTRTRATSTSKMVHWKLWISVEVLLASLLLLAKCASKQTCKLNFISISYSQQFCITKPSLWTSHDFTCCMSINVFSNCIMYKRNILTSNVEKFLRIQSNIFYATNPSNLLWQGLVLVPKPFQVAYDFARHPEIRVEYA
jgi:hypothetical protein